MSLVRHPLDIDAGELFPVQDLVHDALMAHHALGANKRRRVSHPLPALVTQARPLPVVVRAGGEKQHRVDQRGARSTGGLVSHRLDKSLVDC